MIINPNIFKALNFIYKGYPNENDEASVKAESPQREGTNSSASTPFAPLDLIILDMQ